MSSSAITTQVAQLKIGNVQNQADTSAVYNGGNWSFKDATAVTRFYLSSTGSIGLGLTGTLAGWGANMRAIEFGAGGSIFHWTGSTGISLGNNIYDDGIGAPKYRTNGVAAQLSLASGEFSISTAISGTAGAVVTYRPCFFVDSNGKTIVRHIGTGGPVHYAQTSDGVNRWQYGLEANTATASFIVYNAGGVGVFLNNGSTSWGANSDQRMKKNIKALELGLEQIKALKPTRFDYKVDESETSARVGFIAQEVLPVLPHAVSVPEDSEQMMGVSATEMIPVLVKAIQELSAQVEELKAKLP